MKINFEDVNWIELAMVTYVFSLVQSLVQVLRELVPTRDECHA
jgi:hypothetical protein